MTIINTLKKQFMLVSRKKKLNHFYSLHNQPVTILDVGVSTEIGKTGELKIKEFENTNNYFLKHFRYQDSFYYRLPL